MSKRFSAFDFSLLFPFFFLTLILSACNDIPGGGPAPATEPFIFGGSLYVTNGGDGSLLVFDGEDDDQDGVINNNDLCPNTPAGESADADGCAAAQKASAPKALGPIKATSSPTPRLQEGNISPSRRFPEAVSAPSGLFLDRSNDTLYVANTAQNTIAIYENASTLATLSSPTRVIAGDRTRLNHPFGVTYDAINDRIFVANRDSNSIVVFDLSCATSLAGNIAPCRWLLIDGQTPPHFPRALAIDTQKNLLYISTAGNDSILVYENPESLGASPDLCMTDFNICTAAPHRVIGPHGGAEDASKLELPFGIYVDSQNDRLYVANTGLNRPSVLIYENASIRDSQAAEEVPERVITGLNTQLTVPAGIDVDVASGHLYVINNNSPNNVNQSTLKNVDSPSLVVYNNIDSACSLAMHLCNLTPGNRLGGDVATEVGTTLASPIGVALDPLRNIIYIANTGGNNILFYALEGSRTPSGLNTHFQKVARTTGTAPDMTNLQMPNAFYYNADIDRLYVANFGSFGAINHSTADFPVIVYDRVSSLHFDNTPPSWRIKKGTDFDFARGVHIDTQRGYLLLLSASKSVSRLSVFCIPMSNGQFSAKCTDPTKQWTAFPTNTIIEKGSELTPPPRLTGFTGLTANGAKAMAVEALSGDVYVADSGANAVFVYNLDSLSLTPTPPTRTIVGGNTGLNKPEGLAYDAERDVLYVSNPGNNTMVSFDAAKTKNGNVAPNRTLSTTTLAEADKLKKPIALTLDVKTNWLYLISASQNAIFGYRNANTINGEKAPDRKMMAAVPTAFDFTPPQTPFIEIGGLLFVEISGKPTLFVGQPESPTCNKGNATSCPLQAFYVFNLGGNIAPSRIWSGGDGTFASPAGIGVDTTRDVLYVANQVTNSLSILSHASQVNVNINPSDLSQKADLSNIQLNRPAGLFIDSAENRLYLSNASAILVFKNADQLVDGTPPSQTITHAQLNNPRGLKVDATSKRLYVASTGSHSVLVFKVDGDVAFDTALSGPATKLKSPIDVAVDPKRDLLYVLNDGTEILVFEAASTLSGNVTPTRIITGGDQDATNIAGDPGGNNFMVSPSALFVDSAKDLLYLSDPGAEAVFFFLNASTIEGRPEEIKTLSGDNTGLNQPSALFVDTSGSP